MGSSCSCDKDYTSQDISIQDNSPVAEEDEEDLEAPSALDKNALDKNGYHHKHKNNGMHQVEKKSNAVESGPDKNIGANNSGDNFHSSTPKNLTQSTQLALHPAPRDDILKDAKQHHHEQNPRIVTSNPHEASRSSVSGCCRKRRRQSTRDDSNVEVAVIQPTRSQHITDHDAKTRMPDAGVLDPQVLREPIVAGDSSDKPDQALCEPIVAGDSSEEPDMIKNIFIACSVCQYEHAERLAKNLPMGERDTNGQFREDTRRRLPELDSLRSRIDRVKSVLESCAPQKEKGWKQFDLDSCSIWRRWDSKSGAVTIILSWVAKGALLQHIAAVRDADAAESLWNGAFWDMRCEHAEGISLNRWLEKDPFTRKKLETIMERTLCDCLDHDRPCWVLVERSPPVEKWESFSGKYKSFDIPACPSGFNRAVTGDGGRVIEPLSSDGCRVWMSVTLHLPSVIRWALTDGLLCMAVNMGSKSSGKSWDNIIDNWNLSGYNQRMKEQQSFYDPVRERIDDYMRRKNYG